MFWSSKLSSFCSAKKHFWTQQVVDSTNASQDMMKQYAPPFGIPWVSWVGPGGWGCLSSWRSWEPMNVFGRWGMPQLVNQVAYHQQTQPPTDSRQLWVIRTKQVKNPVVGGYVRDFFSCHSVGLYNITASWKKWCGVFFLQMHLYNYSATSLWIATRSYGAIQSNVSHHTWSRAKGSSEACDG